MDNLINNKAMDDIETVLMWLAVPGILMVVTLFYLLKTYRITKWQYDESISDVIIVGSGVLGSALAAVLARDGRRVVVIERDLEEPDRIVGELLQPGGIRALKTLGLLDCVEGLDAHTIQGYVIHDVYKRLNVHIPYPSVGDEEATFGRAFHHGRFIMKLREAARAEPNVRYIEGTVTGLLENAKGTIIGVYYREKASEESKTLHSALTVVADGCFSKLRKTLVKTTPSIKSYFVGLIMENCPQVKANHAELVLANPSPVLIYQISSNHTRVLVDVGSVIPRDVRSHLSDVVAPQLPEHLNVPFLEAVNSGSVRSMPNNFMAAAPIVRRGAMCLGDALNMRHPLTGGGMTVALNDVVIWRELIKNIADLRDYRSIKRASRKFYFRRKSQHSFVVNVLSMALYELFSADNDNLRCLKMACFEYFQLGGECVAGPVSLLSVLNPNPILLLSHFFAVVVYAIYFVFKTHSFWYFPYSAFRSACIFADACKILFPLIWSELKFAIAY